ncbi:phytochelatin synthase family protein [Caballeronia sp. LjRoot34]|uniref:phytochelatin synthase family protein n=1 Tax=Caballeronia sp. LjRoot34 TaxID=3342325 RepID=UPI003ECC3896
MLFTLRRAGRAAWPTVALAFALTACAPLPPIASHVAAPSAIHRADGPLPVPPDLIALTQAGGQKRLISAAANQSYWPLSEYFETQRNEAYCSVATSVMALNALGIRRPESTQYPDFPYFSQEDFFRGVDPHVANADRVAKEGMTLDQLSAVLSEFPVDVEKFHSANLTLAQFRKLILDTTGRSDRFVLLNFRRVEIGEVGGGHWSPIAAFDVASDSALVLDVARYKYPAVWVPIAKLYAGSQAVDSVSGLSRGIVTIGRQ